MVGRVCSKHVTDHEHVQTSGLIPKRDEIHLAYTCTAGGIMSRRMSSSGMLRRVALVRTDVRLLHQGDKNR
jgi:hypothetical protein